MYWKVLWKTKTRLVITLTMLLLFCASYYRFFTNGPASAPWEATIGWLPMMILVFSFSSWVKTEKERNSN